MILVTASAFRWEPGAHGSAWSPLERSCMTARGFKAFGKGTLKCARGVRVGTKMVDGRKLPHARGSAGPIR